MKEGNSTGQPEPYSEQAHPADHSTAPLYNTSDESRTKQQYCSRSPAADTPQEPPQNQCRPGAQAQQQLPGPTIANLRAGAVARSRPHSRVLSVSFCLYDQFTAEFPSHLVHLITCTCTRRPVAASCRQ